MFHVIARHCFIRMTFSGVLIPILLSPLTLMFVRTLGATRYFEN